MVTLMTAVLFDTLKMVETLQAGGFSDQQARAMTNALGDAATVAQVATRGDVMDLGIGMKHDFDALRAEIRADSEAFKAEIRAHSAAFKAEIRAEFEAFKTEVRHDLEAFKIEIRRDLGALEQRMTIKLGTMMLAMTGVLFAGLHFIH
jgi:hypothetical protein